MGGRLELSNVSALPFSPSRQMRILSPEIISLPFHYTTNHFSFFFLSIAYSTSRLFFGFLDSPTHGGADKLFIVAAIWPTLPLSALFTQRYC